MIVQDRLEWGRLVIIAAIVVRLGAMAALAQPGISSLSARQHYPWNGLVDVDCVVEGEEVDRVLVDVVVADLDGNTNLPTRTVSGTRVVAPGEHRLVWNADADILNDAEFTNLSVIATASIGAGLVSYYPLDAHGRDVISGHDLGNWESLSDFTWARGLSGDPMGCADFNGAVAANPTGLAITNSFTISFWAKASGGLGSFVEEFSFTANPVIKASYPYVIFPAQGSSGYAGVGIAVGTNGLVVVEHSADWFPATLITNITVGTRWNHFALTVNESGAPSVYMNGKLVRTGKASTKTNLLGVGSCVGGDAYGHYEGMLDNLLIYDRALSADEIQQLADTPLGSRKVVFDPGEGSVVESSRVYVPGDQYGELPKAKRSGYMFKGWCRVADASPISEDEYVVANEVLTAKWDRYLLYMIVDLSEGETVEAYPVSYTDTIPAGGWSDKHKTEMLVLRRIDPGVCVVSIDEPYYIGVFEVTQKQYGLITGLYPSYLSAHDMCPVEQVSYAAIRGRNKGAQYPSSSEVDEDSALGKLRQRTGLEFDLPTEAQWEYACRAGATTTFSYGDSEDGEYMWYKANSGSSVHDVGTRKPNQWGLYDFHGNVSEWCLDWYSSFMYPQTYRIYRGGCFYQSSSYCDSSSSYSAAAPSSSSYSLGFRIAVPAY